MMFTYWSKPVPLCVLLCFLVHMVSGQGCSIDLKQRSKIKAYVMIIDLKKGEIVYPMDSRTINFSEGQKVGLFCHSTNQKKSFIRGVPGATKTETLLKMVCQNKQFINEADQSVVDVAKVKCSKTRYDPEIKINNKAKACATLGADGRDNDLDGKLLSVSIGWNLPGFGFKPQIDLCVDNKVYGTLWTKHTIQPGTEQRDKPKRRPPFRVDTSDQYRFYGGAASSSLSRLYTKTNQAKSVTALLGSDKLKDGSTIIGTGTRDTNFFAKGHLSPDAAFFYDFEQTATYYFINVAPQFQSFNNGNWKYLEEQARHLAHHKKRKMTVYQGTLDILAFKSINTNAYVEIYLRDKKTTVPAPLYYWKVIHDEEKNQAVGFLGSNNPYDDESTSFLCPNICDQLNYVQWDTNEIVKGRMACCTADDIKAVVNVAPDLSDTNNNWPGLLKNES